jgi:anti-sigma B factor antagonist
MDKLNRIKVDDVGDVAVVRFLDRKILDEAIIQELGGELQGLVEIDGKTNLLLCFENVEFLSSAALGKLIKLNATVKKSGGQLKMSNIRPEIYEVFAITRLHKFFEICEDETDALATF